MKTRELKQEDAAGQSRSVLECGGPPPLSGRSHRFQSARGLAQSKTWRTRVASCLFAVALGHSALAQYSIDWHTIDGGGSTSTGGVYSVSGTIGQPDASATMSGGNYSLTGGFWALYAVQTPGAPLLSIFRTSTNTAVVSWPSPSAGWNLQQNTSLATTNWVAPAETINNDGTNKFIIVNPPVGNRFYRLINP